MRCRAPLSCRTSPHGEIGVTASQSAQKWRDGRSPLRGMSGRTEGGCAVVGRHVVGCHHDHLSETLRAFLDAAPRRLRRGRRGEGLHAAREGRLDAGLADCDLRRPSAAASSNSWRSTKRENCCAPLLPPRGAVPHKGGATPHPRHPARSRNRPMLRRQGRGGDLAALDQAMREALLQTAEAEDAGLPHVLIFGGGHVGHALASAFSLLPVRPIVVETRADALEGLRVETRLTPVPEEMVREAPRRLGFRGADPRPCARLPDRRRGAEARATPPMSG